MNAPDLSALIKELIAQPRETEWLEFKHNNSEPVMIGERIRDVFAAAIHVTIPTAGIPFVASSVNLHASLYAIQTVEQWNTPRKLRLAINLKFVRN